MGLLNNPFFIIYYFPTTKVTIKFQLAKQINTFNIALTYTL